MSRKTYYFTDATWWDDPGCDCCKPTEMPAYNCKEIYHTCHDVENIYRSVVEEEMLLMNLDTLRRLVDYIGVNIEVNSDDDL